MGEDVDQHEVGIGATGDDAVAFVRQRLGQRFGVDDDLLRRIFEVGLQSLAEGHGFGGDDVHQRAALLAGEDASIDCGGELLLAENQAGARSAQGLVRGGGDDVRVGHGRRMNAAGDESGEVGHVDQIAMRRPCRRSGACGQSRRSGDRRCLRR